MAARRGAVGRPRDGAVERPVHLEHARSRSGTARRAGGPGAGSRSPAIARSWRGRDVEQDRTRRRAARRATRPGGPVTISPPSAAQLRDERIGDGLRSAADHRPADGVGVGREDQPERRHSTGDRGGASRGPRPRRTGPAPARRGTADGRGPSAERSAGSPNRAIASGWRGDVDHRPQELRTEVVDARGRAARTAAARPGRRVRRDRRRWPRPTVRAPPPGRRRAGWANGRVGVDQVDAVRGEVDGPEERRGDAPAAGSSSRRRGGTPGASAPASASRRRRRGRPRRPGPSARHGPA